METGSMERLTAERDKALARASELDGFRRYWKDKADTMVRKFDAAQAHAWELEQQLKAAQQPRPMAEAPRDGKEYILILADRWHIGGWAFNSWRVVEADGRLTRPSCDVLGWLPLPDQSGGEARPYEPAIHIGLLEDESPPGARRTRPATVRRNPAREDSPNNPEIGASGKDETRAEVDDGS